MQLKSLFDSNAVMRGRTFDAVGESLGLVHCCDMIHPTEQAIFPLLELAERFLFPPDSP